MKLYPSIPSANGQKFVDIPNAYIFYKLDGSNFRAEWSKKKGWYKFGTRTQMIDASDPTFGPAVDLWKNTTGLSIEPIAHNNKWEHLVCFAEFWGASSFAGTHDLSEPHQLSLFDIAIDKRGISGPKEFLKYCANLNIAPYLGQVHWSRDYVAAVRRGEISSDLREGVIGKAGHGHQLIMAKAKTQAWIDQVKNKFDEKTAARILD